MSTLYVLLPPAERVLRQSAFARWLARGDCLSDLPDARTALTRELFRFEGAGVPVAALRHHCHAEDAADGVWLAADPAYVRSEATGARLMNWPLPDLGEPEARELAATLAPLAADAQLRLAVDTAAAWALRLPSAVAAELFTAPVDALGAQLLDGLPAGEAGRPWRRLFSEIQILLHAHPVNAARLAAGKLPANALWLWGAGALPRTADAAVELVASNDDILCGLARVARVRWAAPTADALGGDATGSALLDLGAGAALDASAWLAEFQRALTGGRFAAIELVFADGGRVRVRRLHRLRFWRRA